MRVLSLGLGVVLMLASLAASALPNGFVDLHDVDPSIVLELRYTTNDNFIGHPLPGYEAKRAVLTQQAADALKKAQAMVKKEGYSLVVYDAYRPQRASGFFKKWSQDLSDNRMQSWFYPRIDKKDLFALSYIAEYSSHNRGSTVDITLIPLSEKIHAIKPKERTLRDGFTILFLDDGTLDMGTSFDLFDKASHYDNDLIDDVYKKRRNYLRSVMEACGFEYYPEEWWHFTLNNEPFPETYFDF